MKTFYHATPFSNLIEILDKGIECRNIERIVYLCEKPEDCLKFARIHGNTDVLVLKVRVPDKDVIETFDHSEAFFKCRCFASTKPIKLHNIVEYVRYTFD